MAHEPQLVTSCDRYPSLTLPLGSFSRCDPTALPGRSECVYGTSDDHEPTIEPDDLDALIEHERAAGEQVHVLNNYDEVESYLAEGILVNQGFVHVYYDGVRLVLIL